MSSKIFEFESDFAGSLRCIPMAVRLKLDLVGIKLSLRQWSRLTSAERSALLHLRCALPADRAAYANRLEAMVSAGGSDVIRIAPSDGRAWTNADVVPELILEQAVEKRVSPPTLQHWMALTDLQRFALIKLARAGHENQNFLPAMREFEVVAAMHEAAPGTALED